MISVLIPTVKRPDFLHRALTSVAEQTALGQIAEIVVSENGGDSRSGEVCKKFPGLPIRYILRDGDMSMIEHFSVFLKEKCAGELVAFLHDDDWWEPRHIEAALECLAGHPEASSYGCCYYVLSRENTLPRCETVIAAWFGARYPALGQPWVLSQKDVMLACLVQTPVQYSTMVMRADAMRKSARVFDLGNPYDNDRMLSIELSLYGPLVYSPFPRVMVRTHPAQVTRSFGYAAFVRHMKWTTEWLIQETGETWKSAGDAFYERIMGCPAESQKDLYTAIDTPWGLPFLAEHGEKSSELCRLWSSNSRESGNGRSMSSVARQICPPFIWNRATRFFAASPKQD